MRFACIAAVSFVIVGCQAKEAAPLAPRAQINRAAELTEPPKSEVPEPVELVYDVGGEVTAPRQIGHCTPPIERLHLLTHGRAVTQPFFLYDVVVSSRGEVLSVALKRASMTGDPYDALERETRECLANCRFEPGRRKKQPVAVRFVIMSSIEVR